MASDLLSFRNCTYCEENITLIRVKCAECEDIDLCLQCFAAGAEIGNHKNNHPYQIIDIDGLDLFMSKRGWGAREEILLLDGIEHFGFDNWREISAHVETRTAAECRDEYMTTFVDGNIGRATWPSAMERRKRGFVPIVKHEEQPPLKLAPIDITFQQAFELDYMPRRDDFDKEYENNAESLVSDLNVSSAQDDELDVALKLAQVDMYNQKLQERNRRKQITRDYQLVSKFLKSIIAKQKLINNPDLQNSNGPTESDEPLKFMCQFLTCQEFESLLASWNYQVSLRKRAAELCKYRAHGLLRFEEVLHFEQEAAYRDKDSGRCSTTGALLSEGVQNLPLPLSQHLLPTKRREKNGNTNASTSTGKSFIYPTGNHTSSQLRGQQHGQQVSFSYEPGHLLTSTETKLCASLDLTPSQFISMKTLLIMNPGRTLETETERQIRKHIDSNGWFII